MFIVVFLFTIEVLVVDKFEFEFFMLFGGGMDSMGGMGGMM